MSKGKWNRKTGQTEGEQEQVVPEATQEEIKPVECPEEPKEEYKIEEVADNCINCKFSKNFGDGVHLICKRYPKGMTVESCNWCGEHAQR